jgi:cell division protein ZipA
MGQSTDLLVIILIVAIVAVVLDGLRRKWRDRQDRVVMKLDKSFLRSGGENAADDVLTTSELPNGGARTVTRTGSAPPPRKSWSRLKNGKTRGQEEAAAPATERAKGETVPVLMDTVEVEETDIEHANVFASTEPSQQFTPEEFDDELSPARVRSNSNVVEDKDMLDAQVEGLDQLRRDPLAPQAGRKSDYDDEDEFEDEDEDLEEDEDEEDDEDEFDDEEDDEEFEDDDWEEDEDEDDEEEEDEEGYPRRVRRAGDDEEWEDEEDDWDDEDDDEEEEDEDDEEEDDEDDWGEEEDENYSADYENEPTLLEETYNRAASRAASHFARPPAEPPQARIEPGFGEGEGALDDLNEEELLAESFSESFTEVFEDEGLDTEGLEHFNAEPVTAGAARPAAAEKAEKADKPAEARDIAKDAKDKLSFFSKSLLGRQQQVDLFQEEGAAAEEEAAEPVAEDTGPREVIIINVMARPGYSFNGSDLLAVVREQGLQLGEMSIFHRHEQKEGRVLFSMANMVKPGTFNLAAMDDFATPGVSLFLQLPCKSGNMAAFDLMLGTALALREQLDGELKDEQRSVFTRQTIEHVRQRIRDFELALLSRR